jgi:hypothetical protein
LVGERRVAERSRHHAMVMDTSTCVNALRIRQAFAER